MPRLARAVAAGMFVAWACTARPVAAADDGVAAREIAGMIEALGASGCRFERNGRWYEAGRARAHLQRKYDWARRRGLAGTAEEFIDRAASRSSISGRPYQVRCPGRPDIDSQAWFRDVLGRLRARGA
jgi:hypothetical protein